MFFNNKLVAEFLGTLILLIAYIKYGKPLYLGIALALATFMFGGAYNPIVSLMQNGFNFTDKNFLMTVLAQVAAAYFAVRVANKF